MAIQAQIPMWFLDSLVGGRGQGGITLNYYARDFFFLNQAQLFTPNFFRAFLLMENDQEILFFIT